MISMLNQATNGNDLLAILDTLTEDVSVESDTQPTLETIEFWLDCDSLRTGTESHLTLGFCAILTAYQTTETKWLLTLLHFLATL